MRSFLVLLLITVLLCNRVSSETVFNLASSSDVVWTAVNKNGSVSVPGNVPGGIYSDLQKAKVIDDILYGFNDVTSRWVGHETWTYTGLFNITKQQLENLVAHLVFHGVDTVAFVELNNKPVGSTNNMFVRYVFNVKEHLKEGVNELNITFVSPIEAANSRSQKHYTPPACVPTEYNGECHVNQLRKMQASFSWDWGPAIPSVGLWKEAAIEFYNGAIIRSLTVHTKKKDDKWKVIVKVFVESGMAKKRITGQLRAALSVEADQTVMFQNDVELETRDDGTAEADINFLISENVVRLWWPNGFGEQPLYNLCVSLISDGLQFRHPWQSKDKHIRFDSEEKSTKQISVGFRTLEIVETSAPPSNNGSTGLTFYFKVNGYPIFMKGTNWIPADILPEFGANEERVDELLTAARDVHTAMMRVWGGGVYESDYFYKRCDQLGILVWQDFMFACAMYPVDQEFVNSIKIEVEQNVIRLQHHPSIAVWAGNNENEVALRYNWYGTGQNFTKFKSDYITLYVDTIKPIVESLDPETRYLASSPSNGIKSEQEGYIAQNPYDPEYGDTHYYNYMANNWNQNIYPLTRFASEYGLQSFPSLFTMRTATKDPKDFAINSQYTKHRQHSPMGNSFVENQLQIHFNLNANDSKYFEKFVFYSQISQAMAMKAESEFYRQSQADWYTMGALFWQLNDVWQAPSWSGIEYGGKWKMMHYYAKCFFAPVLVSPRYTLDNDVDIYLINDRFVPIINADIIVDVFNWSSLIPIHTASYPAEVQALSAAKQQIYLHFWKYHKKHEVFLRFSLKAEGVVSSPYNFVFPKPLKSVKGLRSPHIQISVSKAKAVGPKFVYNVDITVDTVVLFLWLDTNTSDGHFEDNGFIMTNPNLRVEYMSKTNIPPKQLKEMITYQYYVN